MIQIFDIKKAKKNLIKVNDKEDLTEYIKEAKLTKEETLKKYKSNENGLTAKEANQRLEQNGKNKVVKEDNKNWFYFYLKSFKDQFIIILIFLSIINFCLGDKLGSAIIVAIAFISANIRFVQDYSVYKFNKQLKNRITSKTNVVRGSKEQEIRVENVVLGDIISLNAGAIIPADVRIIESKDLFINQSVFTGESAPIEKKTILEEEAKEIFDIENICLMGASVISGKATAIVIRTGFDTYLGKMGKEVDVKKESTNFEKGMKSITNMLIRYMIAVCLVVLIVDGVIKGNFNEAILFALSVAVGITPSMLPMIVNVNLTKGSKSLAKKKTLVKKIESIQNLGAIDILCTDKTGTLTEDKITLQKYIDIEGKENINILEYAYLNSFYGTGMKNLVDRAILAYGKQHQIEEKIAKYEKVDEIPFDYDRKKMSVIVKNGSQYRMITKGALEEIIKSCTKVKRNGQLEKITQEIIEKVEAKAKELAETGMQVIALAEKRDYPGVDVLDSSYEKDMTFIGFIGFLDPPKKGVANTLNKLRKIGVKTKILTGDNPYATKNICNLAGLNGNDILLGTDIDKLTDEELAKRVEEVDVFARLNPLQKERVVATYKNNGHVVGYMGDGVNDAPSLHNADVGICVDTATDIAKEASDIILLEKSLKVIFNGVIEGRKVYGNIIKYMKMALSSDFGDVFSIFIASIFLPFLPLLPIQMLIQDFLYDFSQIAIPYDNVDKEFLLKPKKWDTKGLGTFMNVMGPVSSIIDVFAFLAFWFILGYNGVAYETYFQTAWFVECLISETLIIHFVRTAKIPFVQSKPSPMLFVLTMVTIIGTILAPIVLHNVTAFHFEILPLKYYGIIAGLTVLYVVLVQIVKKIYIKKIGEWL